MAESTNKETKDKSAAWRTLQQFLVFIAIILIFTVVTRFINYGGVSGGISFDSDSFDVEISDGTVYTYSYSDIQSISLEATPDDLGTCVSGDRARALCSGIWENETWGTYIVYLNPTLSSVIVMEMPDQIIVMNYEDDTTTESLYEAFLDIIEEENGN